MTDKRALPYPPPWMDKETLAAHLSCSANTVENWSAQGVIPQPRKRGGKVMYRWAEVDEWLANGNPETSESSLAERIRNGTRTAAAEASNRG
jgi:predicted site-specific integrase-resolvase